MNFRTAIRSAIQQAGHALASEVGGSSPASVSNSIVTSHQYGQHLSGACSVIEQACSHRIGGNTTDVGSLTNAGLQ